MSKTLLLSYCISFFAGATGAAACLSMIPQKKLRGIAAFLFISFGTLGFILADAYLVEPNWIQTEHVVIHDEQLALSLGGLKIVQISDIHLTRGITRREKDLIEKINRIQPDMIFITGDFFDDLTQAEPAVELIRAFRPKIGIWGVPGNTDHIVMDGKSFSTTLAPAGIRILVNESQRIQTGVGKYFWLTGVDENVDHHDNLPRALGSVPPGSPNILLAHSPDIFEKATAQKINLVLAGHTHGGQVGIPFLIQLSEYANRTPYMKGLFKKGKTQLYINRGIGTKTLPLRFLCRPEITVLEVTP